ncbi:MAG: hypothetical protein ABMA13_02180 [Chthoniobacteraceae bacterium]
MTCRFPFLLLLLSLARADAQTAASGEAEAAKCLDHIASVRRDVLGKYEDQLGEMQAQMQKAADLESALTVRAERKRVRADAALSEANFVAEPRTLRALQQQTAARLDDLCASVVAESIPRLVELKKQLTIAGQLDDAVAVRGLIEKLQNEHVPLTRPATGALVQADTLVTAYAADRARADKAYKEARVTVRGALVTYRIDPADSRKATIYLGHAGGTGWVACIFEDGARFREDKSFNTTALVISSLAGSTLARWQTGQTVEIQGTCEGFEDVVRLAKCELPK